MNYHVGLAIKSFCLVLILLPVLMISSVCAADDSIITFFEQRDLELSGSLNKSHRGVVAKLGNPQTMFGRDCITHFFTSPTADVSVIEKRQAAIQELFENQELLHHVTHLLKNLKAYQYGVDFFLHKGLDPAAEEILKTYYFSLSMMRSYNDSALALTLRDIFKKFGLFMPVIEHLLFHFAMDYIYQVIAEDKKHDGHCHHHDHKHGHHHHGGDGHSCIMDHLEPAEGASTAVKGLFLTLKIGHFGLHAISIYEMVSYVKAQVAVLDYVHDQVIAVQQCLATVEKLSSLVQRNEVLASVLPDMSALLKEHKIMPELSALFASGAFELDDELGFFSTVGPTLRAYSLLRDQRDSFKNIWQAVGQLDAYATLAQVMCQHQHGDARMSFVRFKKDATTPSLVMKGLWNIMLNPDMVTTNDVELGANNAPAIMVVTGPNKAGKSSTLKALGLNVILAQSFGIACACDVEMTPFDALMTYITVTDDITCDTSLMVAELARADSCLKKIQELAPNKFGCILIDDSLFKGTTFHKREELAYQFVEAVGRYGNTCGMVATHTMVLTQLAQVSQQTYFNAYIPTVLALDGNVTSTFTVVPGIANPDDVLALVRA